MTAPFATYAVEGVSYAMGSARCRTCRSPHRHTVECLLAEGTSYAHAARTLPADAGLSAKNLREHARRGHVPVQSEVIRRVIERAGTERAEVLENGVAKKIRSLALASAVLEDVHRRLHAGELELTFQDGVRAAQLLMEFEAAVGEGRKVQQLLQQSHRAIAGVLRLAKAHMAPDDWSSFLKAMEDDARLRPFRPLAPWD